jgi:hypothetical protein
MSERSRPVGSERAASQRLIRPWLVVATEGRRCHDGGVSLDVSMILPMKPDRTPEQVQRRRRVLLRRNGGLAASVTLAVMLAQAADAPAPGAAPTTSNAETKRPHLLVTAASLADNESRANIARLFRLLAECDARMGSARA